MVRKHVNRRGKKSRQSFKKGFRSHDPELNKGKPPVIKGRNAAPSKGDDSVISTTRDIKVRDETVPFNLSAPTQLPENVTAKPEKKASEDPRAEMRRRGEEKRKLLAVLKPAKSVEYSHPVPQSQPLVPLFVMDSTSVVRNETPRVEKKKTKQVQNSVAKPSSASKIINATSKYTDKKRQKMRDREREKRAKKLERKQSQQNTVSHHSQSQRQTTVPIEGPIDSLREMGAMLAAKLSKEKTTYQHAYEKM